LIGKKNVDLIWCVQLDRSLDGYARDLSWYSFFIKKRSRPGKTPIFIITTKRWQHIIAINEIDLVEATKIRGLSYYSTETSRVDLEQKKTKTKTKALKSTT
jgi:hypothetical protein